MIYKHRMTEQKQTVEDEVRKLKIIYGWFQQRCSNPKRNWYYLYGWRWIKCLWNTPTEFANDMIQSYKEHRLYNTSTMIDRIDVDWPYCKENCKWATRTEQNLNTRRTIYVELLWEKHTLKDWCRKLSLPYKTIWARIKAYHYTPQDAITKDLHMITKLKYENN